MKSVFFYILLVIIFLFNSSSFSQVTNKDTLTFAFWNMENLFDTINDPGKNDGEFTPTGAKKWTSERLEQKLKNMAKVISLIGKNGGPDILGMCEVEHQSLVDKLVNGYLKNKNYGIAYKESPDKRGIDNGLIYDKDVFTLLSVSAIHVELPTHYPTRDILKVVLKTGNNDTLFVFVNHWPSRRGGQAKSEKNRFAAASTLKENIKNLIDSNQNTNILIIGDFNDTPIDKSFTTVLNAKPLNDYLMRIQIGVKMDNNIFNLAYKKAIDGEGTYNFRKEWNLLDQMVVSGNMLKEKGFSYLLGSFKIFKMDFMIEQEGKYKGSPLRTYGGKKYLGGYSDHFPILAKFVTN